MNRQQIKDMKESIKSEYEAKIKKLGDEMQAAFSSLSKVEETLFASNLLQTELPISIGATIRNRIVDTAHKKDRVPSVRVRIEDALDKIQGEFTTQQLLAAINTDGMGEKVDKKNFLPRFSRLKKDNVVIVVSDPEGNRPGKYKKGGI
jgi:hypothetical protein